MYRLSLFGPFSLIDHGGSEVCVASKKAKALLAYLAQTPGKPRSREEILALLWSDREEAQGRASLRQVLTGLRKEVGEGLLHTDRDSVMLNADAVELNPPNGEEFISGLYLADPAFEEWLRDERLRLECTPNQAEPPVAQTSDKPVIAVLPFENLSNDSDQAFFSDGITEDIMTELSRFDDMVIISPRATFQFRNTDASTVEIGRRLASNYIVEGSVRKAGGRVRISAKLTEAETEAQIWAERYDRDLTDVFEIQEEVARQIASTVPGQVHVRTLNLTNQVSQKDLTAYQHVLRGEWLNGLDYAGPAALDSFEKAIVADPTCARAYANLADWYGNRLYLPSACFPDIQAKVRQYVRLALEHVPDDTVNLCHIADAHLAIGDYDLARRYLEKAIESNPNHYKVMIYAASIYAWLGETAQSLLWLDRYWATSPFLPGAVAGSVCEIYYMAERYEDAIAALSPFPDYVTDRAPTLAAAYAQLGQMNDVERLRMLFEESKPEGFLFKDFEEALLRTCACERERQLWREGYRKAGFM